MVSVELFLADEMNSGIIIGEIVGHGLDLFLNFLKICAFLSHNEALSGVFLSGGQLRILAGTNLFHCFRYRNRVLDAAFYSGYRRIASEWPWLTPLPQKV